MLLVCLARAGLTVIDCEELWQLLFADDVPWVAAGPDFVDLILSCHFTWTLLGTPFKGARCRGGLQQVWQGYRHDLETFSLSISARRADWLLETFSLGISAERADWLIKWIDEVFRAFVEAPLLFMAEHKAEDDRVDIGGWCCADGGPRVVRWFSLESAGCDWPVPFTRVRNQSLIATWELIASPVSLVLFLLLSNDATTTDFTTAQFAVTEVSDNECNCFAVLCFLTSAFPLTVFLMVLSIRLQRRALRMDIEWVHRDNNKLADALANVSFEEFDMAKHIMGILKAHFTTAAVYAKWGRSSTVQWNGYERNHVNPGRQRVAHETV